VLLALLVPGVMASVALASNAHLKGGNPSFTDGGLTLNAMGELAGLGNGDVLIELTVTADGDATCTNPAAATQPPGQNPAPISVNGVQPIPRKSSRTANALQRHYHGPVPGVPDCPTAG
jgi:hypothetical protein